MEHAASRLPMLTLAQVRSVSGVAHCILEWVVALHGYYWAHRAMVTAQPTTPEFGNHHAGRTFQNLGGFVGRIFQNLGTMLGIFQHDRSFLLRKCWVQGPLIETTALLKELTHDFASQCQVSPTASVLHGGT